MQPGKRTWRHGTHVQQHHSHGDFDAEPCCDVHRQEANQDNHAMRYTRIHLVELLRMDVVIKAAGRNWIPTNKTKKQRAGKQYVSVSNTSTTSSQRVTVCSNTVTSELSKDNKRLSLTRADWREGDRRVEQVWCLQNNCIHQGSRWCACMPRTPVQQPCSNRTCV